MCGLWKRKTSLRKRVLCLAMLAEQPFVEGEKLQAVHDICYIPLRMFILHGWRRPSPVATQALIQREKEA